MAAPNQITGLMFPLVLTGGSHTLVSGTDLIQASIKTILSWPIFTKYFEDNFGSRIHEVIEEPNDDILFSLIYRFVIDAISTWEKRVELTSVTIDRPSPEKMAIGLTYRIKELNLEDSFYYNYQF